MPTDLMNCMIIKVKVFPTISQEFPVFPGNSRYFPGRKFSMTAVFFSQKLILRHDNTKIYDQRLNELYMLIEVKVFPTICRDFSVFPRKSLYM